MHTKYLKYVVFLGLTATIWSSCDEDRFSPITEVTLPPHVSKIVIAAEWIAGSDSLSVFVTKSRSALDRTPYNYQNSYDTVSNATVELLRNGTLLAVLPKDKGGFYRQKGKFRLDSVAGARYTIRVSAQGFQTIEAEQVILKMPEILRGSFKKDGAVFTDPDDPFAEPRRLDEVRIEFNDPADEKNVYQVSGFGFIRRINRTVKRYICQYSENLDVNAEETSSYYSFSRYILPDLAFNGKSYVWRFGTNNNNYYPTGFSNSEPFVPLFPLQKGDRLFCTIESKSDDFARYKRSARKLEEVEDNPFFTEPVSLFTNVKNGYGYFFISSVTTKEFLVE